MKNLTDKTFGNWKVMKELEKSKHNKRVWLCKCICDREFPVLQDNLVIGKSTGCINCRKVHLKHGLADNHRLYLTWKSMLSRCNNPNNYNYRNYGGRGIAVCAEWKDFTNFLKDMEDSFLEGLTLDRKNVNLGYYKENCRWSNIEQQSNNKRNSLKLEFNGEYYTEAQLSRLTGVKRTTIQARRKKGATVEEMIYGFKRI